MPRKKAKKITKGKTVSSRSRKPNRSVLGAEWFGVIVPLFLGLGAQFIIPFESTFGVRFGWICFAVALGFSVHLMWKHIAWPWTVKALLACITAAAFLWFAHRNMEGRLRPSFIFVTPGFWIPGDTWDFIINHRGPKTSYNPQIFFVDQDRQDYMRRTQASLSITDINTTQILLSFPDVNPKGHGSIFAHQFRWKPFAPAHAHFNVDITWRDGAAHQELAIAKVQEKWTYRIKVIDRDSGKILFWCRDKDYPTAEPTSPCLPRVAQSSD